MMERADASCVHVCQGPPRCELQGDDAVEAQKAGCPWCRRIYVFEDGTEVETGPMSDEAPVVNA